MSYDDDFIKVKASSPELEKKIHIKITDAKEKIYWYIKFNIMLDEESITNENMFVTDREGYILNTEIKYKKRKNLIVISPLDDYAEGVYYILNITKNVRSENLNNLKNDIHILFKIKENRVSDFVILPPNVIVPKPIFRIRKPQGKDEETKPSSTKLYSFDKYINRADMLDKLPMADLSFNPILGAIGIILTFASLFLKNIVIMGICGFIALMGLIHIVFQLTRPGFRSDFVYNRGVKKFNKDDFDKAAMLFDKALKINPNNEYAEYAKNKMSYYKE